ncbi:hypothetical protein BGZ76_008202 [Entomortierella beljakovae]|nr:hypothetical protein BGZ76_008202 [Entomortierella beljakovae]
MITLPPQEIAAFLGNHLDHVLQQTESDFGQSLATNRQFKAGCALMDVLNSVESVQERIREFLHDRGRGKSARESLEPCEPLKIRIISLLYSNLPIQMNPFLCFFMDMYTTLLHDDQQRPERFVVSIILSGEGEELAPSTPAELIAIALEVDPKLIDLQSLEDIIPDAPIGNQITSGLGWESLKQHKQGDKKEIWEMTNFLGKFGSSQLGNSNIDNSTNENPLNTIRNTDFSNNVLDTRLPTTTGTIQTQGAINEEDELEEWEIEAEKHFQDSDDVAPAPAKLITKPKKPDVIFNRQQLNAIMELASIQPLSFDQEQFMLSQFSTDAVKVHIPLPPPDSLPGIVDNNPTIAFNLLQYLIQLSSELDGGATETSSNSNGDGSGSVRTGKVNPKDGSFDSPESSIVDSYLNTMTHAKHLTLHSLEVVNRLSGATTLSPQFLHAYIENAIRCCELVDDKTGQARVVRMLCVFLQSLLRNGAITIPGYFHALQSFCVQFARVKEVATLFQSLVDYQAKLDVPPIQTQGPSIRAPQQPPQQPSRQQLQSASMPSTPTADTPQRSNWLASSGSISNVKSTLSKHTSLNGFSSPGALSQFIHPGPSSPASSSSGHQNGGGGSSNQSFSNGSTNSKTHQKHLSQHSSGSLFSTPTVISASVNAFNTGLGNPTNLSLNGGSSGSNGHGSTYRTKAGSTAPSSAPNSAIGDSPYDLDAALRASLKDMETRSASSSSSSLGGSPGFSSNVNRASSGSSSSSQQQQQQQQQQQAVHLGPKGLNTSSHLGNQARGRGARRGG